MAPRARALGPSSLAGPGTRCGGPGAGARRLSMPSRSMQSVGQWANSACALALLSVLRAWPDGAARTASPVSLASCLFPPVRRAARRDDTNSIIAAASCPPPCTSVRRMDLHGGHTDRFGDGAGPSGGIPRRRERTNGDGAATGKIPAPSPKCKSPPRAGGPARGKRIH